MASHPSFATRFTSMFGILCRFVVVVVILCSSSGWSNASADPKCGNFKVDGTWCQFSPSAQGKALHRCAFGYASAVTGGAAGESYIVTSPDDSPVNPKPGTLRYGVAIKSGVWITFAQSMNIFLKDKLWLQSSTTIDGRGFKVTISGAMFSLRGVSNVILHNLQIDSPVDKSQNSIHISNASKLIWLDHLTCDDSSRMYGIGKIVSVVEASTDVTISNSILSNTNYNTLLGASDENQMDRDMRVTVYRNWFKDSTQRMPHCRWGFCHVVNNLYSNWGYYAIGARARATVKCEANVFEAGKKKEITPWDSTLEGSLDKTPDIESSRDLLLNGATFHQFVEEKISTVPPYKSKAPPLLAAEKVSALVRRCAGALDASTAPSCVPA